MDCSNPIYNENEIDNFINKKNELERECIQLEKKLFDKKRKLEEIDRKIFCYNFNYYFVKSLK